MKKILRIVIFSLLTPFFFTSCNKSNPVPPPEPIIPPLVADVSLLTYDTKTVEYELPEIPEYDSNLLEITSSDTSLFTIKNDSFTDKVVIESNLENKIGIANINFIYDEVLLDYSISVAVNYPQTYDEAVDAFSLACIKLPANTKFTITFNFYNLVNYEDFDASLEIYGWRGIVKYYNFEIGTSKTIGFEVDTNASYGTVESDISQGDYYYQEYIGSFNYLSRDIHSDEYDVQTYYIDQVEKTLNVKNSEELFWSVEHGYRPILPNGNVKLNTIYDSAKSICERINPKWSNLVKFRELFDYLVGTTHYDNDPNLADYGSASMSYYLEGVFLDDGIAVCDGFSKAYSLLCGILGLPCFRSYGFPEGENTGHAWNYVQLDGNWYLVCPTWAKIGLSRLDEQVASTRILDLYNKNCITLTSYDSFLASKNYFKNLGANYSDLAHPSVERSSTAYAGNIDEINYRVRSDEDALRIKNRLENHHSKLFSGCCLYFEFDEGDRDNFEEWCQTIASGKGSFVTEETIYFNGEDCICLLMCFNNNI